MISMEMMGKIRRMYFRDRLSLHEITKRTGLARNTIRKWVRAPETRQPVHQRRTVFSKLSAFSPSLGRLQPFAPSRAVEESGMRQSRVALSPQCHSHSLGSVLDGAFIVGCKTQYQPR